MIEVFVPTRGRPAAALELLVSFRATVSMPDTRITFVVDHDDPLLDEYRPQVGEPLVVPATAAGSMVKALNYAVMSRVGAPNAPLVAAFLGDDHRFRSNGWDARVTSDILAMGGTGFVYGDDLAQRENLPTQVFVTADIVKALGWMAPPFLRHLYVDNAWKSLGEGTGRLRYDPAIVIEHLHPAYGKAEWDDNYKRVNSQETYSADGAAFMEWTAKGMTDDLAKIEAIL